jgi:LCP family protein required for cell wall assembly
VDGVKINMLFAQDPKKLTAAVEKLTGVKVDHYAAIQMRDVGRIAYLLNVEVCLRAAITDPVTGVPFRAGKEVISGDHAVAFLRQRQGLPNGDLDRIKRHQVILAGVASQLTKEKAVALARGATGMIKVDEGWDVLAFAQRFTGPVKISMSTLPVGEPVPTQNGYAFEVDPAKSKEFTDKALAGKEANPPGDLCVN